MSERVTDRSTACCIPYPYRAICTKNNPASITAYRYTIHKKFIFEVILMHGCAVSHTRTWPGAPHTIVFPSVLVATQNTLFSSPRRASPMGTPLFISHTRTVLSPEPGKLCFHPLSLQTAQKHHVQGAGHRRVFCCWNSIIVRCHHRNLIQAYFHPRWLQHNATDCDVLDF